MPCPVLPIRRCVGVVIDNDNDVLVAFLIACLVNADIHRPSSRLELCGSMSFNVRWTHLPTVSQSMRMYSDTALLGDKSQASRP